MPSKMSFFFSTESISRYRNFLDQKEVIMKQQCLTVILLCTVCLIFELPEIALSWQNLAFLDLSSNLLEGPIPSSICNSKKLEILVLANNNFRGNLPSCLGNFSDSLLALDLRNNYFSGTIPTHFSKDIKLKNIGLNGNNLEGPLPRSLTNCRSLEVLDVGNNRITDNFPMWLANLPLLHVLILRSNRFYGTISPNSSSNSNSNTPFQKLRILDASHNNFTGAIPFGFLKNNLPAIVTVNNDEQKYIGEGNGSSYYLDSITLEMKGFVVEIKRVFSIYTTIDLSANKFEGEFPESIGNLQALKQLILSGNSFTGSIPTALGELKELESLDLSSNHFSGQIPRELQSLTFLSKFNVSENQLSGPIPPGTQLQTFDKDSYYGNKDLCGFPLKDCVRRNSPAPPTTTSSKLNAVDHLDLLNGFTWKSVAMGYGFGITVGLFLGSLMLFTGQPKWVLKIVEDSQNLLKMKTNRRRRYVSVTNWH